MVANYLVGFAWLGVMFYIMLFCQHRICEAYFVPALNVLMEKMGGSSNRWLQRLGNPGVAGATFMALGANGPELFTNLFALFQHNDGGIGVVIGSEIFNLLVIIGASIIAAPGFAPMELEQVPFARDVVYYAFSIALLVWAMKDEHISFSESCIMLAAGLSYWCCVYFTDDIANKLFRSNASLEDPLVTNDKEAGEGAKIHGKMYEVSEIYHTRMGDKHQRKSIFELEAVQNQGVLVEAPPQRGRGEQVTVGFTAGSSITPPQKGRGERVTVGFTAGGSFLKYDQLAEVILSKDKETVLLKFKRSAMETVTLRVKSADSSQRDALLSDLRKYSLKDRTWIHDYDPTPINACKHFLHGFKHSSCLGKLHALLEFFVDFILSATLFWCDVKDYRKENRWTLLFACSMIWLAIFSYFMVIVMGLISANIPELSPMLIGVTLGAIGTSLPNCMGSVIMAQQGKSAAAIGNAFGSNVQNVFLAMAGPWAIYLSVTTDKDPSTGAPVTEVLMASSAHGQSVNEGVKWMLGTLVLVVCFAVAPPVCRLARSAGYVFCLVYVVYLAWTIYECEFI